MKIGAVLLSVAFAFALQAADKPNILFLLADQWRAQAFGFAGDPNVRTPHIDKLHQRSISFVNAVSGVPVCSPTRASLLTGQRALTHGLFLNDAPLKPEAVTIAEVLKEAGYDTGYIGKWHVDGHGRSEFIPRERRQGFDYWKVLECTHTYSNSFYYGDGPEKLKWDGYDAIPQTRDAIQYLKERSKELKPFFLFLAWGPPHSPYHVVPKEYRDRYEADAIELRPNVPPEESRKARSQLAGYYAHCSALDECVGELMTALSATGLNSNTIVVFTSDHGDLLGSHNGWNKQQPYDESVRIPLLLHWPAAFGEAQRSVTAPINSEDFMPTLLGLCKVRAPKPVEGLDYSHYLRAGKDPSDGAALIACPTPFGQWLRRDGGREYRGVRTARHTYVRDLRGPWLLFDNQTDPYQTNNLVNRPEFARLQAEMEGKLKVKLKAASDEFLPGEAYIRKWGYEDKVDANGTYKYTH